MRGLPWKIVRDDKYLYTRDRKYRINCRWGLMWVAYLDARCRREGCYKGIGCSCAPVNLPGGIHKHAFRTKTALQEALRKHYERKARRAARVPDRNRQR